MTATKARGAVAAERTEPEADRFVTILEAAHLIEGRLFYPAGATGVRVAYAVADQFGWAVMAKRGRHVVTVARADRPNARAARARAVELVGHFTAGWQRPTAPAA